MTSDDLAAFDAPAPTYGDTCQRAIDLMRGDRDAERGDPLPVLQAHAALVNVALGDKLLVALNAEDVALFYALGKVAREVVGGHAQDNMVDAAAYLDFVNYAHAMRALPAGNSG